MALESVATNKQHNRPYLPLDAVNRGDELCHKLAALVECMRAASLCDDPPIKGTFAGVCWIADEMVRELNGVVNLRPEQVQDPDRAQEGHA